jgi:hypothetical protein
VNTHHHQPHQQPEQVQFTSVEKPGNRPPEQKQTQPNSGQFVQATCVNSSTLNDMFKVATLQQIMTELSGAVSEEDNILAITKIVFNLL